MKKLICAIGITLCAAACTTRPQDGTESLEVEPTRLEFGATAASPQEIAVKAVGVEWEYAAAGTGGEWMEVVRSGEVLTVTVLDNPTAEQRTSSVTVLPVGGSPGLKARTVTVIQEASDTPVVYTLSVEPSALTFDAEGASPQKVTVTAEGDGLTWSTAVDADWITVTEQADGFSVSVSDNPDTAERAANITVTPSESSASPKAVRVVQEARVLPPSLKLSLQDGAAIPEEGIVFDYKGFLKGFAGTPQMTCSVLVAAVNLDWSVRAEAGTGAAGWLTVTPFENNGYFSVQCAAANEAAEARTGRLVVTTDAEGVGPFEIPVMQEGKPEFYSTITENVDFGTLTGSCNVTLYANGDRRDWPCSRWDMVFMSEGVTYNENLGRYEGTGEKLTVQLATGPIMKNDDNLYDLPEGTYTVTANFSSLGGVDKWSAYTISGGTKGFSHPNYADGTWYQLMEEGAYGNDACITEGTMTVTKSGEVYNISFDFISDALYRVTGAFEGQLTIRAI